jgi:glycosyltransferase involved in cell wall biosynthesis
MRIALVHSYYSSRQPSGENVVVDAQAEALTSAGHDVLVVARSTDEQESRLLYPARAAWTVATGRGPDPTDELLNFAPDVVHVHNLFPNFGTRWLERWQGPLVATMHNFRPMCAAGTLYRDGHDCTLCPDGQALAALRHGCYRSSRVATVPVLVGSRKGIVADPVIRRADSIIVLTDRARDAYRSYGVEDERLHLVPNFVTAPPRRSDSPSVSHGRWMYAGRLSPEKGVEELLRTWPEHARLDLFGSGPLATRLSGLAGENVRIIGAIDRTRLRELMPEYAGLIFPSRWREGLPLAFLEALAAGLPCLAVEGSSVADCVGNAGLGIALTRDFSPADVTRALSVITEDRAAISARCRQIFLDLYSVEGWIEATQSIYARSSYTLGTLQ